MFGKRFSRALAVTTVASLVMAAAAFAVDNLATDGDSAGGSLAVNFGSVCPGDSVTPTADNLSLWLVAQNRNSANYFANDTDVSVTATSVPSGLSATSATIATADDWESAANGSLSDVETAKISLTDAGATEGARSATVVYTASGAGVTALNPNITRGTVTRTADVTVNWTVKDDLDPTCAPSNTAPTLTLPADMTVEGNSTGGAEVTYTGISASDTEDGDISSSVECTPASGSFFALGGPVTVSCSVEDSAGASDSGTFDVTVVDTTDPTIDTPANITTTTMNASGKVVTYTAPNASDIVDSSVDVNCAPASGSTFPIGPTTVTCTATDDSGNSAQSQFTVQVSLLMALWKEPINGPSVVNVAKAGRVIPVKVELFVDGVENVNTGLVTFKLWKSTSCTTAAQDAVETFTAVGEASGGSSYVWNADGGFYQYNLKTPSTAGCYRGEVYLNGELAGYFLINSTK